MFVENIEEDEFVDVNEDFDNRGDIVQDIVIDTEVVYGVSEEVVEVNVDFGGRETAEDAFVDTNMEFGGREAPGEAVIDINMDFGVREAPNEIFIDANGGFTVREAVEDEVIDPNFDCDVREAVEDAFITANEEFTVREAAEEAAIEANVEFEVRKAAEEAAIEANVEFEVREAVAISDAVFDNNVDYAAREATEEAIIDVNVAFDVRQVVVEDPFIDSNADIGIIETVEDTIMYSNLEVEVKEVVIEGTVEDEVREAFIAPNLKFKEREAVEDALIATNTDFVVIQKVEEPFLILEPHISPPEILPTIEVPKNIISAFESHPKKENIQTIILNEAIDESSKELQAEFNVYTAVNHLEHKHHPQPYPKPYPQPYPQPYPVANIIEFSPQTENISSLNLFPQPFSAKSSHINEFFLESQIYLLKDSEWKSEFAKLDQFNLQFSTKIIPLYDISKIKMLKEPTIHESRKLKLKANNENIFFSISHNESKDNLPLHYIWFTKITINKLKTYNLTINTFQPLETYRETHLKNIYVQGMIYKRSQHFKKWVLRYVIINHEGLFSYNDNGEESFTILPESITEIWTRFESHDGRMIIKMHHKGKKTEFAIPISELLQPNNNWLYSMYRLMYNPL